MNEIKEAYVSFKTARLLKERGFDVPVFQHYTKSGLLWKCQNTENFNAEEEVECYSAPTQQLACRWIREVHNLSIVVDCYYLIEDYNESPYFDIRTTEAEDLPCWSVGGLIGVLPQILDGYELRISKWAVEYVDMHNCCDCYYKWCFADDDLIKCLVETILWLLEEGYIKKG